MQCRLPGVGDGCKSEKVPAMDEAIAQGFGKG